MTADLLEVLRLHDAGHAADDIAMIVGTNAEEVGRTLASDGATRARAAFKLAEDYCRELNMDDLCLTAVDSLARALADENISNDDTARISDFVFRMRDRLYG